MIPGVRNHNIATGRNDGDSTWVVEARSCTHSVSECCAAAPSEC